MLNDVMLGDPISPKENLIFLRPDGVEVVLNVLYDRGSNVTMASMDVRDLFWTTENVGFELTTTSETIWVDGFKVGLWVKNYLGHS